MALVFAFCLSSCVLIMPIFATKGKDIELERNKLFARATLFSNAGNRFTGFSASAFTFCLHMNVDRKDNSEGESTIVSYSSRDAGVENEVLLEFDYIKNQLRFYVHDNYKYVAFPVLPPDNQWFHLCVTWENGNGATQLYIDGEKKAEGKTKVSGNVIGGSGYLILGHDQDYYNGAFEYNEGLQGKVSNFNLWDRVLSPVELSSHGCGLKGNVVDWDKSVWSFYGGARVLPTSTSCK